jgi:hypothetical protein
VHEILGQLTSSFPYVVCDLSHSFNDVSLEVFDGARHILVVTLLNLPAIRSAKRCLDVFRQLNYLRGSNQYFQRQALDGFPIGDEVIWSVHVGSRVDAERHLRDVVVLAFFHFRHSL